MNETKQPGAAGEWTSEPDDLLDIAVGLPHKSTDQQETVDAAPPQSAGTNGVVSSSGAGEVDTAKEAELAAEKAVATPKSQETPALEAPLLDRPTVDLNLAESDLPASAPVIAEDAAKPMLFLPSPASDNAAWARSTETLYTEDADLTPSAVETEPQENWFALLFKETLETVVLAVVIFLLIRVAIQNYRIEGSSMEPNFHNGEYLLVNKLAYRLGEYERGDVIVFKYPGDTTKDYIKRVIGLPGDTVEIRDGMLYVNDQLVSEPYEVMPMNYLNEVPRVVEPGTLYVMGDNRPASSDTRDWGLLNQELVIGQAWLAIYPLDTFGLVDHPDLHFTPGMAQGP